MSSGSAPIVPRPTLTVDSGITTTVPIKYNTENRKVIARTLTFESTGITTATA